MAGDINFELKCWYSGGCPRECYNCKQTCHRYLEMNCLINNCGMPNAMKYLKLISPEKCDFKSYQRLQHIKENILEYVNNGINLYISAQNLQTGKTTWSLKILYKFFDEIWAGNGFRVRGYFLYVPEFIAKLRDFGYRNTEEFKTIDRNLKSCDLVVWDDISSIDLTPQEQNLLNIYIDKRFMEDKSNIFNGVYHEQSDLEQLMGTKLATRLLNSETIVFKGKSHKKC